MAACLMALPAWAESEMASFAIGPDVFRAGRSVQAGGAGSDDVFLAGETVTVRGDITGSAHLAGREVTVEGSVGGDVYAAGDEVTLRGPVAGDVTLFGRALSVLAIDGDLRIAGSELHLAGPVAGYAMLAGEEVSFDAAVAGDVSLAAERVEWGDAARIGGRLIVYEETPGDLDVPDRVAPENRIERREIEAWEGPKPPSWRRAILGFLLGVLGIAALGALIAVLVPERLAEMRRQILDRPFHTLWLGFLTQSAVIGAGVLFALTLIGLLLTPAMVLLALVGGFAGYVVAAYAFGVGLFLAFGRGEPLSIGARSLAAGLGALAAGIIGLIPFFGWLFVLAMVLTGVGAITLRVIRPSFFVGDE
ncbi:HTTM domain-containing protein [Salipiger pacificus]|nr:HTTM domain-containing protein [Alloyangia pacifica]MCA0943985.1 HTTM domain-containing protein [Alloyangia pacifica]